MTACAPTRASQTSCDALVSRFVHDIGTPDGSPYVVSELLEGETLRKRISGTTLARVLPVSSSYTVTPFPAFCSIFFVDTY